MQLGQWRLAKQASIEVCDITAMTGLRHFAPDFENVKRYKAGEMNQREYTEAYLGKMRGSFITHREDWIGLMHKPFIAYACYCREGEFCHRHLFTECLTKWFNSKRIQYKLMGELSVRNPEYMWRLQEIQKS
jgi:hypothetical protein